MKTIIIGASLSGKTTLATHLRSKNIQYREIDEELTTSDVHEKYADQIPKILKDAFAQKDILLIANTDYLTLDDLREAKKLGFKIYQLEITVTEATRRNQINLKSGKEDLSLYLDGNFDYQSELKRAGLIDKSLDATLPVEKLVKEII
ncbi:hypothetical protein KBC75_00460 [Candidatus Shapirobacteria bacterium]|nr:hypothetical protein [Candidatus Shapirobacteria bacterium]